MQSNFLSTGIGAVIRTGISFIPVIGGIISGLLSFFGGGSDAAYVARKLDDLARQVGQALDDLKRFAWAIGRMALGALLILAGIVEDIGHELVKAFRSILDALKKIYDDVIKPALRAIRAIRKILDDLYRKWLRPIINAIQRVRRILAILRAFGFKWAGKLDQRLARIEGKIIGPYLWTIRQLNGVAQWINVILTAGGVLQKPIFRNSLYGNLGWLTNAIWVGQQAGGLAGSGIPDYVPTPAATIPELKAEMRQYAKTDSGPLAAVAAQAREAADSVYSAA